VINVVDDKRSILSTPLFLTFFAFYYYISLPYHENRKRMECRDIPQVKNDNRCCIHSMKNQYDKLDKNKV
jgi:hypothetical protein